MSASAAVRKQNLKPFYDRYGLRLYQGDVFEVLPQIPSGIANCCVTSPPYWGLRDYQTAKWEGGSKDCDHTTAPSRGVDIKPGDKQGTSAGSRPNTQLRCKCGARRIDQQLGLEQTPEEYVSRMVDVFREVRRILRDDGTLWLNIGDSYNSGAEIGRHEHRASCDAPGATSKFFGTDRQFGKCETGLKPKDLVGIPWMLAFALRADGWYLRSEIIWNKLNPMPESVTDRPTKSHEQIFLLAKSEKYYYDAAAIREKFADHRLGNPGGGGRYLREVVRPDGIKNVGSGLAVNSNWTRGEELGGKNKRSVWSLASEPYPAAHFATFPQALITPCILAGAPKDGIVIDPFLGSGTTAYTAWKCRRGCIGVELNPDYCKLVTVRLKGCSGRLF